MAQAGRDAAVRLPSIDRVRVFATLVVVTYHACLAYVPAPLGWIADPRPGGEAWRQLAYTLHALPMPLFFVLAGWLSADAVREHGPLAFALRRTRRLLVPFVLGALTIAPLTYAALAFGRVFIGTRGDASASWDEVRSLFGSDGRYWARPGVAHLWFLEYLWILSVVLALAVAAIPRLRAPADGGSEDPPARWSRPRRVLTFVVAVAALALVRALDPSGDVGEPSGLAPDLALLTFFSALFAFGMVCGRTRHGPPRLAGRGWPHLFAGVAALVLASRLGTVSSGRIAHAATALLGGLGTALGAVAVASISNDPRPVDHLTRKASDASLAIYVLHLPIVVAAQVLLTGVDVAPAVKAASIAVGTILVVGALHLAWTRLVVRRREPEPPSIAGSG